MHTEDSLDARRPCVRVTAEWCRESKVQDHTDHACDKTYHQSGNSTLDGLEGWQECVKRLVKQNMLCDPCIIRTPFRTK